MPDESRNAPLAACSQTALKLSDALRELVRAAAPLQLPPIEGREWHDVLTRKLLPQLDEDPFLVVAVVGGTNIGKSVIFNHVAGCRASATSPLASGTKHPTCLVPQGFTDRHDLKRIFEGFTLKEWTDADLALESSDEHHLYWRTSPELPSNLLVLDTPDIDSDAPVNWLRADRIRACADVLVAVLTQQKYNDAAVKQFFRKAAAEDKAVLAVFNQCLLPDDEPYWPLWLKTFSQETGIKPDLVYVSPKDRAAAEQNRLPFYPRPVNGEVIDDPATPHQLGRDLAGLHFDAIKMRTLRGSLMHLVSETGVPSYLREIKAATTQFQSAAELLSAQRLARVDNWPPPPTPLMVAQVRQWWHGQREGMTRTVHEVYGALGNGLLIPFRWGWNRFVGETPDPLVEYRKQEWDVMMNVINQIYAELGRLSELGNDLLRPRLERLLAGDARVKLIQELTEEHNKVDFSREFGEIVNVQMKKFVADNPVMFQWLQRLDTVPAAVRPATSVAVFAFGAGPIGHVFTDAAASTLVHVAADVAGGTGAVVVGEAALAQSSSSLRQFEAWLRGLYATCTAQRTTWFANFLKQRLLGQIQTELETGAKIGESRAYQIVDTAVNDLRKQLR